MNVQIDNAMKRARGYWFIDGFTEMAAGGLFILLASILLLRENTSQASFSSWLFSIASEVTVAKLAGFLIIIVALWWLKDHFTYPRTGFVRGSKIKAVQVLGMIKNVFLFLLLPIFGLFAVALFVTSTTNVLASMPVWLPVGLGILWSVLFALAGEWMGLRRFRLMGVLILLMGAAIGIWQFAMGLPVNPAHVQVGISSVVETIKQTLTSLSLLVLVSGMILTISGILTFLRYRKENPVPYAEDV